VVGEIDAIIAKKEKEKSGSNYLTAGFYL